jgi:Raf kinase inhibitor-like YbhB/YbcL family protein
MPDARRTKMRIVMLSLLMAAMFLAFVAEKARAQQQPAEPSKFRITASAYYDGDWMPVQYSCGVSDPSSPKLEWSDAPPGTMSFGLIFHDTDAAPGKNAMDVTHWIVWNIPEGATQLAAGIQPDSSPAGIQQGKNIRGVNGYQPPCPPAGVKPHHYIFELYALDTKLNLPAGSSRADLLKAMDGHIIGKASLVGLFGQGIDEKNWPWPVTKAE